MKTNEIDFEIHFIFFWNGSRIPFLEKKSKKYQTDFEIRFAFPWNGSWNSFHIIKMKKKIQNWY